MYKFSVSMNLHIYKYRNLGVNLVKDESIWTTGFQVRISYTSNKIQYFFLF